jgi:hypothetical protein
MWIADCNERKEASSNPGIWAEYAATNTDNAPVKQAKTNKNRVVNL